MRSRPALAAKVLHSTPQEWFGRPTRQISDGDMHRWEACVLAAKWISK